MRYLVMHKHDEQTERGVKPPPELVMKMSDFIDAEAAKGVFLGGEGLGASATRTRLRFRDGRATVKHGPYTGEHELPGAMALLKVRTRDEAIGWAERYGKILGDGEIELGPVVEPWDLGFGERPADAPLRILLIEKEEAAPRTTRQKADLTRLLTEMKKADVLVYAERLKAAAESKRLFFRNGDVRVVDGPFSESKELVGGFGVMKLDSLDDAVEMGRRYADVLGDPMLEIDVRPIED